MLRSSLIAFCCAFPAFAALDFVLHAAAIVLGRSGNTGLSLVASELLLPYAPVVVAGLVAGYLGTPNGFALAFLAALAGGAASIAWRFAGVVLTEPPNAPVWWSAACWLLGLATATGVCGWAGERLHAKRLPGVGPLSANVGPHREAPWR